MARPLLLLLAALLPLACTARGGGSELLREYRLVSPRRELAAPVWLASFTSDELFGRLSRDGRRLLYAGDQKGNLEIWLKDLTTGVPERLTDHVAIDTQPCWSPDEKRIAFVSMRQDAKGDIFLYEGGRLTQLTDRSAAEAYPAFAPDGKNLYFAAGPEGQSRIERMDLASRTRTPVTGWGSTHPAPSPDGRWRAYTLFDDEERGRLAVLDLRSGRSRLLTTADYHAGFPAFSPDSRWLVFVRFLEGAPGQALSAEAVGSIWRLELEPALAAASPEVATALAEPLTSGRTSALFPHLAAGALVFTSQRAGSLDIGMLPERGAVPPLRTAAELLELAARQDHPRDELLVLTHAAARGGAERSQALYRSTLRLRDVGEFDKAGRILRRLAEEGASRHGDIAYLARIDERTLLVQRRRAEARQGGRRVRPAEVQAELRKLDRLELPPRPSSEVASHLLLRRGDLLRMAGEREQALEAYQRLLREHPRQRARTAEASFRLGEVLSSVPDPDLLSRYYLTLFSLYPDQLEWLRRAGQEVLALQARADEKQPGPAGEGAASRPGSPAREKREQGPEPAAAPTAAPVLRPPGSEAEALRALLDRNRDKPLFCAMALRRLAAIHEAEGQLDLAIQALHEVAERYASLRRESTEAAFELGRLSLLSSERLRAKGRLSEALASYGQALSAYERIVRRYEPGHEHHARASSEYLRLSLLEAGQLERDGERVLAEKRYRRMLELDPGNFQAHRKLIQMGVARGRLRALRAEYRDRVSRDPGDAIGHYGLGYLATFAQPLEERDLAEAEKHLGRAIALSPQSPFGHMTLGWVYEMRERFLGQTFRGWLEEAIVLYDRAYALNDARLDVQTEADLLVNLCSAFANLGNGWKQAQEFCSRREKLRLPFISRAEEASYHLTYGRAASATGRYEVAARELERALDLARDLGKKRLEAEVVARMALNAHLQGDHEGSARLLRQAAENYRRQGQQSRLAGLVRSIAYEELLQGNHGAAGKLLAEAGELLRRHGAPPIEGWAPVASGAGRSSAPFGFDALDENHAALALRELVFRSKKAWPEILSLLEKRIANRRQALEARKDEELGRELLLLQNRLAMARLRLGQQDGFFSLLEEVLEATRKLQVDPKEGYRPDAYLFPLETAFSLSVAEQVLGQAARGEADANALQAALERLRGLESQRAQVLDKEKTELLPPRLRLALWNALALLSFHRGLRGAATAGADQGERREKEEKSKTAERRSAADQALERVLALGQPLVAAQRLLRMVMRETAPDAPPEEDRAEKEAAALERGVLAPLWRPLSPGERLRWHLLAGLNLAEVSASVSPTSALEKHPSTELLTELARLGNQHEVGALRFALAAELAARRRDLKAMQAAVDGYLSRPPFLFEETGSLQADLLRRRILRRAQGLALELGELGAALGFAEQEERRAFVEELCALPPEGRDRAAAPLATLLSRARAHRQLLGAQDPAAPDENRKHWRERLSASERAVVEALVALEQAAPRVGGLFRVPAFPLEEIGKALRPDDVAVAALTHGGRVRLLALRPGAPIASEELPPALDEVRRGLAAGRAEALLGPTLRRLAGKARRIFIDLGRLQPDLRAEPLLGGREVVRLAGLWELADARAVQHLAPSPVLVADPRAAQASLLARKLGGAPRLAGKDLRLDKLGRPFEEAGVLIWAGPLRFDGGEAANMRLLLHDTEGERLGDLRLGRVLGLPLRGQLLVVADPRFTPGRQRAERMALARLVHAMGVPSLILCEEGGADPEKLGAALAPVLRAADQQSLAGALAAAGGRPGRLALYGHPGFDAGEARAFARAQLKATVAAGAAAFNARKLGPAVEQLELAVRYMEVSGDRQHLDGALLYLANAYTLLEDYARAVPKMERLLGLQREGVEKARQEGKPGPLLAAQAKLVQTLQRMAWLRFRYEQYKEALIVNRQAIDLYLAVKRPLLAQPAYDQRSLIAEKQGDMKEALEYARLSLETARKVLAQSPKSAAARSTVAAAATRLARLLRVRFSDYAPAMEAARLALAHSPDVSPEALASAAARLQALRQQAQGAESKSLEALQPKVAAASAERERLFAGFEERLNVLLEISRIHSARGDYSRAVEQAEEALELARRSGQPLQALPLLEVVNNLYYMGRYARALEVAEEGLRQSGQAPLRRIQFFNAQGSIYAALGRTVEALRALEEALKIAVKLGLPAEVAASHNNIGNALRLAGRFAEARQRFEQALQIDRRQKDRLGMAFDHANLGLTHELMGRRREALAELGRALELSREIGAPLNELKALAGLGRLELAAGRAKEALERLQQGLARSEKLGLRNWSWRFHLLAARAQVRLGDLAKARQHLERGIGLVEELPPRPRQALGSPKVEEDPEDLYDELIDLLAQQGRGEAALDLAERLRARSFIDRASQGALRLPLKEAAALLGKISTLLQELEAARAARARARSAAEVAASGKEVGRLAEELRAARQALAAINPQLPSLVHVEAWPLARLRSLLQARAAVRFLYYHLTERHLIIWALQGDRLELRRLPVSRRQLEQTVAAFRERLLRYHRVDDLAARLHGWLVAPVLPPGGASRLVVIPSGPLHVLPFAALVDRRSQPLIAQSSLAALPSLNALRFLPARRAGSGRRLSVGWAGRGPAPLRFGVKEAEALAATLPGTRLLRGEEATRQRFLAEAPAAELVHLASHGRLDEESPLLSSLQLADGDLSVAQVLGMSLRAELVVLSACETGLGPLDGADAVLGLHQAFLIAGARRVISSLWRVSDLGSALLMKHAARRLARGEPAEAALRGAQNEVRRRFPHPAFWAGFRLDGAVDP